MTPNRKLAKVTFEYEDGGVEEIREHANDWLEWINSYVVFQQLRMGEPIIPKPWKWVVVKKP